VPFLVSALLNMLDLVSEARFALSMPTLLAYATAADAANAQVLGLNMDTWIILTLILLAISSFLFVSHWFNIARHGK
jgi:hypothetical protein|tara:strand:+ start:2907 stop:3137 length:231 start_codon:yes stop_codon:yes gene_type:complete